MPKPANLVTETSTTTGTGNLTIAVSYGQRFSEAFATGGSNTFDYFIVNESTTGEWERGTGSLSDANTLVRDTVIESSNSNAVVNFSAGTKRISNDIPAEYQVQSSDIVDLDRTGMSNIALNPTFSVWLNPPSSGTEAVASPSGGGGHVGDGRLPNGWYGGPGTGGEFTWSRKRPLDAMLEGATGGAYPGFRAETSLEMLWTVSATALGSQYLPGLRATILEQIARHRFNRGGGRKYRFSFWGRISPNDTASTTSWELVPILWMSAGGGVWAAGVNETAGMLSQALGRLYKVTASGTSGTSVPTHTSGSATATGGTAVYEYIGQVQGQGVEVWEGVDPAAPDTPVPTTGSPGAFSKCTLTTTWQKFEVNIATEDVDFFPAVDTVRRNAYFGIGLDILSLPQAGLAFEITDIQVVDAQYGGVGLRSDALERHLCTSFQENFDQYKLAPKARAYFTFVTSGSPAIRFQHNIASVTRSSAGIYVISLTRRFLNTTSYHALGSCFDGANNAQIYPLTISTSQIQFRQRNSTSGTLGDYAHMMVEVHADALNWPSPT